MFRIDRTSNSLEKLAPRGFQELSFRERDHLQEWIAQTPDILGEDLLVVQKEFDGFDDTKERLDLLALDKNGRLVIIENKLDDTGRDVVWQALKYASYCSTLKKARIAEIYRRYLSQQNEETDAEERIASFLDAQSFDEVTINRSNDQRIFLIAANFRKEVTATALWLLNHQIDIRCVKVSPFSMGDELLLNVEQIIPTPEAEDYMIGISEKEAEAKQTQGAETRSQKLRYEFWTRCLDAFRKSDVSVFDRINPGRDHWQSAGSGASGCPYQLIFSMKEARVQIEMSRSDRSENKFLFDKLLEKRETIEKAFESPLEWKRLDDGKSSRIQFQKDYDGFDQENWEDMIHWMITHMRQLEKAIGSELLDAYSQLA